MQAPPQPTISVVIPVFNERENLMQLHQEITDALARIDEPAEVLYVDDRSTDGSRAVLQGIAEKAAGTGFRVRVLLLTRNFGQTAALAAGFDAAEGELVVSLDGDLQNNPADLPGLVAKAREGYDVVSGWRRHRRDKALSRRLPSRVANWLVGRVSGLRLHDYGCTLKVYRRELLQEVNLYGDMHRFIPVYVARLGGRVCELEVDHRPRTAGVSKYGISRVARVALDLVLIKFITQYYTRPMHFFGQVALVFFGLLAAVGALMLTFKYGWLRLLGIDYRASFIETPLPALAATFLLGGIVSLFFGVVGEILIRVHHEAQGTKPYRIARTCDSRRDEQCAD